MAHSYRQHAIHLVDDSAADDDSESCFGPVSARSIALLGVDTSYPTFAEVVPILPESLPDPFILCRLAETYDANSSSSFAHAENGSKADSPVNDAALLFAYRPLKDSKVRLLNAVDHARHPLGAGFLSVPTTTDCGIAGAPASVFIRTYHTPTIPGIILSHSAVSKQLGTTSYNMSSHTDASGFIHFPHYLHRCQDVYVTLQPWTSQCGGLTFTEALVLPMAVQHAASIVPSSLCVLCLHLRGNTRTIAINICFYFWFVRTKFLFITNFIYRKYCRCTNGKYVLCTEQSSVTGVSREYGILLLNITNVAILIEI